MLVKPSLSESPNEAASPVSRLARPPQLNHAAECRGQERGLEKGRTLGKGQDPPGSRLQPGEVHVSGRVVLGGISRYPPNGSFGESGRFHVSSGTPRQPTLPQGPRPAQAPTAVLSGVHTRTHRTPGPGVKSAPQIHVTLKPVQRPHLNRAFAGVAQGRQGCAD